jgi:hypothetical protein
VHVEVPGLSARVKVDPPDPRNPNTNPDDAYPAIIRDQRTMHAGGRDCETAEDVFWRCWVPWHERQGRTPKPDAEGREVVPYVNHSRWVADCPACNGGMACWDRNPYACCGDCARIYKVLWQPPAVRAEAIRLLAGRVVNDRNWLAHQGETTTELALQNVLMTGVAPERRDGLLVAANVDMPDNFTHPLEYLDVLQTARRKAAR